MPFPFDALYAGLLGFIWLLRLSAAVLESPDVGLKASDLWSFGERFFSSDILIQVIA